MSSPWKTNLSLLSLWINARNGNLSYLLPGLRDFTGTSGSGVFST